jgi:hypothetical protein
MSGKQQLDINHFIKKTALGLFLNCILMCVPYRYRVLLNSFTKVFMGCMKLTLL